MISELWKKTEYSSGIPYLFSTIITEYDITKANINVLYTRGIIDEELYIKLYYAPREERQKTIGLMERKNNDITKIKADGITEAKRMLFENNNIQDKDILCIRNDAVFLIEKKPSITKFGMIEFVQKNTYTNYIKLNKKVEIYYGFFEALDYESVSVKGLKKNIYLHKEYLLDFILYILYLLDNEDINSAISSFKTFYDDYVNKRLDIGYYREFNAESMYSIVNQRYKASVIENTDYNKNCVVNISYNLQILRKIYGYICDRFFIKNKF